MFCLCEAVCASSYARHTYRTSRPTRQRDGKEYAIKIIRKTRLTLLDVSALLEEVSILAHLRHPHVIRFHDFVEDPWCV